MDGIKCVIIVIRSIAKNVAKIFPIYFALPRVYKTRGTINLLNSFLRKNFVQSEKCKIIHAQPQAQRYVPSSLIYLPLRQAQTQFQFSRSWLLPLASWHCNFGRRVKRPVDSLVTFRLHTTV